VLSLAKFNRTYKLSYIDAENGVELEIESPLTIQFTVKRTAYSSLNSAQFKIYNLKKETRAKIFQAWYNPKQYKKVIFQAGYDQLSTLFVGSIRKADSYRQGNNIITEINALDGGFDAISSLSNETIQKSTSFRDLIKNLVSKFPNLKEGILSNNITGEFKRPANIDGNTWNTIKLYAGENAFIDLEKVNVLYDNEIVNGSVPLISSNTGLVGTPRLNGSSLDVETLFEPRIEMSQVLQLESNIQPEFNGQYKVIGLEHSGIISESIGGACSSRFNLLVGDLVGGFKNA
jgi:hypothetical protein